MQKLISITLHVLLFLHVVHCTIHVIRLNSIRHVCVLLAYIYIYYVMTMIVLSDSSVHMASGTHEHDAYSTQSPCMRNICKGAHYIISMRESLDNSTALHHLSIKR